MPESYAAIEGEIEIRQIFELEDFPNVPPEVKEMEEQLRKSSGTKS